MPQYRPALHSRKSDKTTLKECCIAIGSNLGSNGQEIQTTVRQSLSELLHHKVVIRKISRFFRTPAFPTGSGPDYVNAAVICEAANQPQDILNILHQIEAKLGRTRTKRWESRVIDLDLIYCGTDILPDASTLDHWINLPLDQQTQIAPDTLLLPHPRTQDRAFVLGPMLDIAPDWTHPITQQTVRQMWDALPQQVRAEIVPL